MCHRTKKEHDVSPQKVDWGVSHRKAHLAIVDDPRNSMIKVKHAKALGAVIAPCVMEDRAKIDRQTGFLLKLKSRICYDEARATRIKIKIGKQEYHMLYCNDSDDMTFKIGMVDAVIDGEDVTGADLENAYWHADRLYAPYCWMHTYDEMKDEDGDLLCYQCGAPMNGETTAGSDYHIWRDGIFERAGAKQSLLCLGTFSLIDGDARCTVITCTDDFLLKETAGNGKALTTRILGAFADAMGGWDKVKYEDRPTSFKGYGMAWSRDNTVVTLHMTSHIEAMAHTYVPEVFHGVVPSDIVSGLKLCKLADQLEMPSPRPLVLSALAKETQKVGGSLKYIERGVMPRVSRLMHKLSCVSASPPPEALVVARSTVVLAYNNRYEGITFGGAKLSKRVLLQGGMYCDLKLEDGSPSELEAMADTTTGALPVYALAIMYNGGAVTHAVKKLDGVIPNSCISEAKGSTRASELVEVARNALITFGRPQSEPSVLGTDNSANLSIAMGTATPQRAKPDLPTWASLKDRIRRKLVHMTKVGTDAMPVDFMTKGTVMEMQLAYIINSRHTVWP